MQAGKPVNDLKSRRKPYKLGITGTIASGKSWVGQVLSEAGVAVLDTDQVVKSLYQTDSELLNALRETFGPAVFNPDNSLNLKKLGTLVFQEAHRRRQLEDLVHPRVRQATLAFLEDEPDPSPLRAVLVPLLFETGGEGLYDEIWTVVTPPEQLMERLKKRNGYTEQEAQQRLDAQWSQAEKAEKADRVLDNAGSLEATRRLVLDALAEIHQKTV